jgi:hypothetical protein
VLNGPFQLTLLATQWMSPTLTRDVPFMAGSSPWFLSARR